MRTLGPGMGSLVPVIRCLCCFQLVSENQELRYEQSENQAEEKDLGLRTDSGVSWERSTLPIQSTCQL